MGAVSSSSSTPLVDRMAMRLPARLLVFGILRQHCEKLAVQFPLGGRHCGVDSLGTVSAASTS